jgi:lysyl-tRNA synthetase class 1
MSGKDLIDSVKLSGRICRILGTAPPVGFTYELFLDEQAQKISKSKGNGLSVDEWLRYAPAESLAQFMFNTPQRAKRLYFDVIPRAVDEYLTNAAKLPGQPAAEQLVNPAWFIQAPDEAPAQDVVVPFAMLLNLASAVNAESPDLLWGFIRQYAPAASPETMPFLDRLVRHAIVYFRERVLPTKQYRAPDAVEEAALRDLAVTLRGLAPGTPAEEIQNAVFAVGKRHPFAELRAWFGCLYQVLLGQAEGPRFGGFVALYGIDETVALIDQALARTLHAV